MGVAKRACLQTDFEKALRLSASRWSKSSSEQAEVSAVGTLRGLSADEFLDELLGGKLFFPAQVRPGLDLAGPQFLLLTPAG